MSVEDYQNRTVPEYYPTMYLDGFSPQEILYAFRKRMAKERDERDRVEDTKIIIEVK